MKTVLRAVQIPRGVRQIATTPFPPPPPAALISRHLQALVSKNTETARVKKSQNEL